LLALSLAACSADNSPTAPPPETRAPSTSVSRADIEGVAGAPMMFAIGHAINDSGLVVGYAATASLEPSGAAIWAPPDYVGEFLPRSPGMGYSEATDVSNDGTVLGVECVDASTSCTPTIWRNGTITHLDAVDTATDVCPCDGETVVGASIVDGVRHAGVAIQGFPLDAGVPDGFVSSIFTAVANGHIVGEATRANGTTAAFRWTPAGGWALLPGGDFATVIDVNSHGDAIGWMPNEDANAFWPGDGSTTTLEPYGIFAAINDSGVVAGIAPITQFGPPAGKLWNRDSGWGGGNNVYSQYVAINSQGDFLELVGGNGGTITVVH
jgi:probable HAF family extracellular repeat protein